MYVCKLAPGSLQLVNGAHVVVKDTSFIISSIGNLLSASISCK